MSQTQDGSDDVRPVRLHRAPEHSILTLTYLGYAGADKTATATDKVKVVAVDTSRCTGTAPCDTNNATWANRPDFEVTDTTKTATSHAFAYGSKKYSDGMTVESGNAKKVLLDVTDIIKQSSPSSAPAPPRRRSRWPWASSTSPTCVSAARKSPR